MVPVVVPGGVVWCLLAFALCSFPAGRATLTSTSAMGSDPSCVTVQVTAAPTPKSNPDCPAILVSVTLTASTEGCASDLELVMVMEEYPRDVMTYGGESLAALSDKTIAWSAPSLSAGAELSVEFRMDLCGYCDKYHNGRLNPIDSFRYHDAEGNEPNNRMKGYRLKVDCLGIDGDPVESIVATPAPSPPPTSAPTVAPVAAATPAPAEVTTAVPVTADTPAPTEFSTLTPVGFATHAPIGVSTLAPVASTAATVAPTVASPEAATMEAAMTPAYPAYTAAPHMTLAPTYFLPGWQTLGTAAPTAVADQDVNTARTPAPNAEEGSRGSVPPTTSAEAAGYTTSSAEIVATAGGSTLESYGSDHGSDFAVAPTGGPTATGVDENRGALFTVVPSPAPAAGGGGALSTEAPPVAPASDSYGTLSTGVPSAAPTGGSRGVMFTEGPSAAPTAAPTSLGEESSQGVTVRIQSFFEARRRALSSGTSDPALERRALAAVVAADSEEYDAAMVDVCASMLGVGREDVISVKTDFGPGRAPQGSARRGLLASRSTSGGVGTTATQLTPITTCEVDTGGWGETRSLTAATLIDRMFQPENFVLMLNDNSFGPVNAAVTSISFWQNECRDQTCPAGGDGSYASVYPVSGDTERQRSAVGDNSNEEQTLAWFMVIAGGLLAAAVLSWCAFCLCCGGCSRHGRKPKGTTMEDVYNFKSPPKQDAAAAPAGLSPKRPGRTTVRPLTPTDNTTPTRSFAGGRRGGIPPEPPSPGEADWRLKFGLGPLRDHYFRSAPISPRRARSTLSPGPAKRSTTESVRTSYQDHVVAAANGKVGGKLTLPPLTDDATAAMASQSSWQTTDEMNASVLHNNDPVVRSSLGKAGTVIANALTSPRKELNRLKEALNRPSKTPPYYSASPTLTASTADPSSAPAFGGSEGGFSPLTNGGGGSHLGTAAAVESPIYEIDLEAEENGSVVPTPPRSPTGSGRNAFAKAPGSKSRSRAGSGASASRGTSPSPRSERPAPSDGVPVDTGRSGGGAFSVLATAAALAEVKVGVQSPTGRAVQNAYANGGSGGGCSRDFGDDELPSMPPLPTNRDTTDSPEVDKPAAGAGAGAAETASAVTSAKNVNSEQERGDRAPPRLATSPRVSSSQAPFGGALSGFACLAPQITPRAGSRLPEVADEDVDSEEDVGPANGTGEDAYGQGAPSSPLPRPPPYLKAGSPSRGAGHGGQQVSPVTSLEKAALAIEPGSRTMAPDLTSIAELAADGDTFSDSETESEISSRASSLSSSARSGGRRAPRDPAALLAAAMERAGQIAMIPPPSAGSPRRIGMPLSAVQEVPMEAVQLPGLSTPVASAVSTPRQGGGRFRGVETSIPSPLSAVTARAPFSPRRSADEDKTPAPIPSPAQRPDTGESSAAGGAGAGCHFNPSPARSRQETDEEKEHRTCEQAMGTKAAEGVAADDPDLPKLESPSATTTPAAASGQPPVVPRVVLTSVPPAAALVQSEAAKPAEFSLMRAFSSFLGLQGNEPAVVGRGGGGGGGDEDDSAADEEEPVAVADSSDSDLESPESSGQQYTPKVKALPGATSTKLPKSSLDDGFVDVASVPEVESDDEDEAVAVTNLQISATPVDLPKLVLPDEANATSKPGQRIFSRATMNLQSPGPDSPQAFGKVPMPSLPRPPSSVMSTVPALETPSTVTRPSRISDASPMYDRAAIASAMEAAAVEEGDGESDIVISSGAWPSERRPNFYKGSNCSGDSDMVCSSSAQCSSSRSGACSETSDRHF